MKLTMSTSTSALVFCFSQLNLKRLPTLYLKFDAYEITSIEQRNGSCTTVSGSTTSLTTTFSVARPTEYNEEVFVESAQSSFLDYLEISVCSAQYTPTEPYYAVPTAVTPQPSRSSSSAFSTYSPLSSYSPTRLTSTAALPSSSTSPVPSPRTRNKIIIGTTIPTSLIAILILGIYFMRKYRASRRVPAGREKSPVIEDVSPFFQQKAELPGDSCRYEMEDKHRRQEMQAEEMRHETLGNNFQTGLEGDRFRHELESPIGP